jgi:hypothetical protein
MLLEMYKGLSVTSFVKPELYCRTTTDKNNVRYLKIYESYEPILQQQPTNKTQLPPSPEPMFVATVTSQKPTQVQQISRSCFGTRQQPKHRI